MGHERIIVFSIYFRYVECITIHHNARCRMLGKKMQQIFMCMDSPKLSFLECDNVTRLEILIDPRGTSKENMLWVGLQLFQ